MSRGRHLYELQEADLEIEVKRQALAYVESQLGERQAVDEACDRLASEKKRLDELRASQREREWVVEDLRSRVATLEEKLYGGSVKNPKELASIQEQVEHLKRRGSEEEDHVLDIMTQAETAQENVTATGREVGTLEREWQLEQDRLARERDELTAALAILERKKRDIISRIDAASIRLYEELRAKRQGRAVAKVEQGMCQGCRIVLPIRELQRARGSQELVQCGSCERILYVS